VRLTRKEEEIKVFCLCLAGTQDRTVEWEELLQEAVERSDCHGGREEE
jgi:hypothetical protein